MEEVKSFFEIYDCYGSSDIQYKNIWNAGTTCYASENVTKKTPEQFIEMLKSQQHMSVLEFAWIVIKIRVQGNSNEERLKVVDNVFNNFAAQKYLETYSEQSDLIISGNARAWIEYFNGRKDSLLDYDCTILTELKKKYRILFGDIECAYPNPRFHIWLFDNDNVRNLVYPLRQQHDWIMVKFYNVSRGFTSQFNRSRLHSIAEQSTRYCKMDNFKFKLSDVPLQYECDKDLVDSWLKLTTTLYKKFNEDYGKDVSRQILPLGTCVNICHAARLKYWIDFFDKREVEKAHWEIRGIAQQLKAEFIKRKLIGE